MVRGGGVRASIPDLYRHNERVRTCGGGGEIFGDFGNMAAALANAGCGGLRATCHEGVQAPAVARPRGLPPEKVRTEILATIQQMDEIITRCEAMIGSHVKLLDHPILGPLTAVQWKKLHLVHGLHHVKQIRRLRQAGKVHA